MAKNRDVSKRSDAEELRDKITELLREYNCVIETEDYTSVWIRDKDSNETVGILRCV